MPSTARPFICPILISRKQPLEQLLQLAHRAYSGKGQVALVSGEAGIGKSRLLAELSTAITQGEITPQPPVILQGRCFEGDQSLPYAPLVDLVRTYLNLNLHHLNEAQLAALWEGASPTLHKLLPELAQYSTTNIDSVGTFSPEQDKRLLWQGLTDFFSN